MSRVDLFVTQPKRDDFHRNASLEQVHRRGVAKRVEGDFAFAQGRAGDDCFL